MLQNIGVPGIIILLVIVLIIFGPSKLPEIGRAFGTTLKEFKKSTKDLVSGDDEDDAKSKNYSSLHETEYDSKKGPSKLVKYEKQ